MTYFAQYRYEACFDDGGIGHDSYFRTADVLLDATTDEEAREEAKQFDVDGKPCGSFQCNNRGTRKLLKVYEKTVTERVLA